MVIYLFTFIFFFTLACLFSYAIIKYSRKDRLEIFKIIEEKEAEILVLKSKLSEKSTQLEKLQKDFEDSKEYTSKVGDWTLESYQEMLDISFEKEEIEKKIKFIEENIDEKLWEALNAKFEAENPKEDFFEE